MDNYYNELSQLSILKKEIDRFATSLQNKKAGCFIHRFEQLLNVLPNEFRNQFNFRNKIEDYIKKSNYEKDVKDYILQVFLSFFESIEIEVPNSLRNVVKENESYNEAMIEGYLNFEKAIMSHYKETSYTSPLSFDVFTQSHEDYISEFNRKINELNKLEIQYELEYYSWLKDVADYVFNGIDYKNPPHKEYIAEKEIEAEILKDKNPKKVYENCFWIVDFLEQQKVKTLQPQQPETVKPDEVKKEPKKLAEKWYALLYWIELNANGEQPPKNSEGAFIKSEIEAIRKKVTGKSGQSFYRAFIGIDLNNEKSIKRSFGKEWKKQIIELSKNNSKIIDYIQSKYTS